VLDFSLFGTSIDAGLAPTAGPLQDGNYHDRHHFCTSKQSAASDMPATMGLPILLSSFVGVSIMVLLMMYVIIPLLTKLLRPWLTKKRLF
jgi:hypothetical protein